ncbi:hypothetical protein ACAW74_06465 [Fibrella sp. WM1]|uniref:hypothetical protein n=1 Tax=Fibrella musci TaxID=3242485 RepID=UPI00352138C9
MHKILLTGISLLATVIAPVYAQRKSSSNDSFTQTLKNLQRIEAQNRLVKIQKAPSVDKLILLTTVDFGKAEAILSKEGWQFTGTDSSGTDVEFAYNLVGRNPWYTLTIPTNEKFTIFTFDEKGIHDKLLTQLGSTGFKFLSTSISNNKSIIKLYAKRIKDSFITATLVTNNPNDRTSISSDYFFTIAFKSSYDEERSKKMQVVIDRLFSSE